MFKTIKNIHFVGIGGSGMSGIAEILHNMGYSIAGSDLVESSTVRRLRQLGVLVVLGHRPENVGNAQVVVFSSAVSGDNPEIIFARSRGIPTIPRAEMLAEIMRLKYAIIVGGSHGKTTATSMAAMVLSEGGLDPTIVIGGRLKNFRTNAKVGTGDFLVAEADESDGSFLKLTPTIACITNIDREHMDFYGSMRELKKAFLEFANRVPFYGCSMLCLDDRNNASLIDKLERRHTTYGLNPASDYYGANVRVDGFVTEYKLYHKDRSLGSVRLRVPGKHNVVNSVLAAGIGIELGIDVATIKKALYSFRGVSRRLEKKGEKKGVLFIDDYGHHPTEITATLSTIRSLWSKRPLKVIFQPHRYSRTKEHAKGFADVFKGLSHLWLMDIYPASEKPISGVSSDLILKNLDTNTRKHASLFSDREVLVKDVMEHLRPGDILLTQGAGDVWKIGDTIIKCL